MRKIMKLGLDAEQVHVRELYNRFDGYELHLYGDDRDDFSLVPTLKKPIVTVHYPIDDADVYDVVSQFKEERIQKIFDLCEQQNAGLVIHSETILTRLLTHPQLEEFIEHMRGRKIILHVENCYRHCGAIEGLRMWKYLSDQIGDNRVYPLLDTCHLIMSEMSFKFEEMSFFQTLDAYASENFKIHLSDCIGSGEVETGGIHGTNFYANQYLLSNILWKIRDLQTNIGVTPDLILEVDEVDYVYPTNADILAKNIDRIWPGICKDYDAWKETQNHYEEYE